MHRLLSSLTWRKAAIIAGALLIACGALAVMIETRHAKAIAAAKKYGMVQTVSGRVYTVRLLNHKAVDEVLPLLKDVPEMGELIIGGVDLTPADIQMIGELTQLESLRLGGCDLSGDELSPLGKLKKIRSIGLMKNPLADRGMRFLREMKKLQKIDLNSTTIHGEGITYLVDLPNLKELRLEGTKVDDSTVGLCAKLSRLRNLRLHNTKVTADGLMQLTNMFWLDSLGIPDGISEAAMDSIAEAFVKERKKARASGKDVPPGDVPPFGTFF